MKGKKSEDYRRLRMFRYGREPHVLWKFLAVLFRGYCDRRIYFGAWDSWINSFRAAIMFFNKPKKEQKKKRKHNKPVA